MLGPKTAANSPKQNNSPEIISPSMLKGFSFLNIKGCPVREVKSVHHYNYKRPSVSDAQEKTEHSH